MKKDGDFGLKMNKLGRKKGGPVLKQRKKEKEEKKKKHPPPVLATWSRSALP